MFFSAPDSENLLDITNDRRKEVNYQATESQVNSYLNTVLIDGYLEGTDRKEGGTGILMNDVPGI